MMTNSLPLRPEISSNFTLEDINKLRKWEYELSKSMAREEYMQYVNNIGSKVQAEIDFKRKARRVI